jgi:hypothetical protein
MQNDSKLTEEQFNEAFRLAGEGGYSGPRQILMTQEQYNELADLADKFFPQFNNPKADE